MKNLSRKNRLYLILGTVLILASVILTLWSVIDVAENIYKYIQYSKAHIPTQYLSDWTMIIWNWVGPHLWWHTIVRWILSLIILVSVVFFGHKFFRQKEYGKYLVTWMLWSLWWFLVSFALFYYRISTSAAKPVIYLYPETTQEVIVDLDIVNPNDRFTTIYPNFTDENDHTRSVTANPDGTIYLDDKQYSYLFRESINTNTYDLKEWFVIHRDEAIEFLQDSLSTLWLTPVEYNEMIVYRLPFIEQSPYSLIHFATAEEYDAYYPLTITPTPDSMLRIFMIVKPLDKMIDWVVPQKLEWFERKWFTVVEWWGSYLD